MVVLSSDILVLQTILVRISFQGKNIVIHCTKLVHRAAESSQLMQ